MNSKKFLTKYFFILSLSLIYILPAICVLYRSYENDHFDKIAKKQVEIDGLYGTSANQSTFNYKLSLIKERKPEILILGSSTVQTMRQELFNKKIVNASNGMNYLNEGLIFLKKAFEIHKPRYVILAADFWMFHEDVFMPPQFPYHANWGDSLSAKKLFLPLNLLRKGKVSFSELFQLLNKGTIKNSKLARPSLGIASLVSGVGFRQDGSFFKGSLFLSNEKARDEGFKDTLLRIKSRSRRFQRAASLSESRYKVFNEIISFLNSQDVEVLVIQMPVSHEVRNYMSEFKKGYRYISELSIALTQDMRFSHVDFFHQESQLFDSCEFKDGFHVGEVLAGRLLASASKSNEKLAEVLDHNQIKNIISRYSGSTHFNLENELSRPVSERDFLKLGCMKKN